MHLRNKAIWMDCQSELIRLNNHLENEMDEETLMIYE